jgi:opacity protein-like surface antigen
LPRSALMPLALASTLLMGATQASAQSVQLTPFVGYAYGGSVWDSVHENDYSFDASLAYGGAVNFSISPTWRFELLYSRQPTELSGEGLSPAFDVTIERYLAGFQEEKGEGTAKWFGSVWLGATRFIPGTAFDAGSETKFSAAVGLGVKAFPTKNVGLRLEARGFYTLVKGEGGAFCANGSCLFAFSGTGMWQGDVSAGLILAF